MTRARRTALMRQSGPYQVESTIGGQLVIVPKWSQVPVWTEEDGGGPGLFSRLALAADLQAWLNAPYEAVP